MKSYRSLKIKRIEVPSQSIKFSKKTSKLKKTNINPTINPYKKKFTYVKRNGEEIKDHVILTRIKNLKIPPNYENVLINKNENSNLQAIGYDNKGRRQYIYHPDYILKNKSKKYEKYIILGKYIHSIKRDYNQIIDKIHNKPYNKWSQPSCNIAIIVFLLNETLFRIGNHKYYERYGSFGITTLQEQHITFNDEKKLTYIKFIGKKGVINDCILTDDKLYNIFKTLKVHNTGDFIFDFKSNKYVYSLTGDDIQKYLLNYHPEITAKMFRTWHTNCYFIKILKNNLEYFTNLKSNFTLKLKKKFIKKACEDISIKLHNTATVIKNSYLNNMLFELFMNNTKQIIQYLTESKELSVDKTLMYIEKELRSKK